MSTRTLSISLKNGEEEDLWLEMIKKYDSGDKELVVKALKALKKHGDK